MSESRRKFDRDFREGAVRLVRETGKPIAQVAKDLGIHDGDAGQLGEPGPAPARGGNGELGDGERAELARTGSNAKPCLLPAGDQDNLPDTPTFRKRALVRSEAHARPVYQCAVGDPGAR